MLQLARTRGQLAKLMATPTTTTAAATSPTTTSKRGSSSPKSGSESPSGGRAANNGGSTGLSSPKATRQQRQQRETPSKRKHLTIEYDRDQTNSDNSIDEEENKHNHNNSDEATNESKYFKKEHQMTLDEFAFAKSNIQTKKSLAPERWKEQLDNIKKMRVDRTAPVDDMGCEASTDREASPKEFRLQVLLSALLSAQTRDQITNKAMMSLRQHGCTVDNLLNTKESKIGELIYPVGFWNRKASYILQVCKILKEKYEGDIPRTFKELTALPGIGPKMAHLTMSIAWNDVVGICVDTHVHRISARLGWTKLKPNATPEQTRVALEQWLPRGEWNEINLLLVGFGQQICLPVNPRCVDCLNKAICPASRAKPKAGTKKEKEAKEEQETDDGVTDES